jgi:Zn2+/Cd2+-exporting ATPase
MADCPVCELHAESVFKIEGMDCHEEVAILERRLLALGGLESFDADVVGQRLRIQYDAAKLTTARISETVAQTGMRAWLEHEEPRPGASTVWRERLVLLSGVALAIGVTLQLSGAPFTASLIPYAAAVILAGTQTARRAWKSLTSGHLDIHVL